jgi:hypothetical protein
MSFRVDVEPFGHGFRWVLFRDGVRIHEGDQAYSAETVAQANGARQLRAVNTCPVGGYDVDEENLR